MRRITRWQWGIAATCDLLEIEHPEWLQGRSIMPLIRGEADEIHDAIFAAGTYHAAYEPQQGIRTRRWKYVHRVDPTHIADSLRSA